MPLIEQAELAGLIRRAEARLSANLTDVLTGSASQVADRIYEALLPKLKDIVSEAATAAEPTLRTVANEEVVPKVSAALGISVVVSGVLSGLIGAAFASRGRKSA